MKKFMYLIPATLLMVASCATNKSVYQLSGDWNVVDLQRPSYSPAENTPFVGFDTNEGASMASRVATASRVHSMPSSL